MEVVSKPTDSAAVPPVAGLGSASVPGSRATHLFGVVLVATAILLILFPLLDLLAAALPIRPTEPQWRFGAVGLFSGLLILPFVAVTCLFAALLIFQHRGATRAFAWCCAVAAVLLIAVAAGFSLDFLQLRATAPEGMRPAMDRAGLVAGLKLGSTALGLALVAFAAFRVSRKRRVRIRIEPEGERPMLVGTGGP
jgi:hypothetical protein